jgi:hypothetical protein
MEGKRRFTDCIRRPTSFTKSEIGQVQPGSFSDEALNLNRVNQGLRRRELVVFSAFDGDAAGPAEEKQQHKYPPVI